jgi:hypothetical protein
MQALSSSSTAKAHKGAPLQRTQVNDVHMSDRRPFPELKKKNNASKVLESQRARQGLR